MSREALTVNESIHTVCTMIAGKYESHGWKYLKSQQSIKKIVNGLVFEIRFFSSKWNATGQSVKIYGECSIWYKKLDNRLSVKSSVGYFEYKSNGSKWENTYKDQFSAVVAQFCDLLDKTAIPLSASFEADFNGTVCGLAQNSLGGQCVPRGLRVEFIDMCIGRVYAEIFARNYYAALSQNEKERFEHDLELYRKGSREKACMINPGNFKYIADHNISYRG